MQNEQIEKQFFEAFGIEKKEPCKYGVGCGHSKPCCPRELTYPPITPKIVLGLEEIIIDKYDSTEVFKNAYTVWFKGTEDALHVSGKTREEALLELCIQLKDEIQDQVRTLFKC